MNKVKLIDPFGGSCEREVVAGVTTQYIWIGGDAYTAVAVAKKVGSGSWTVYNIFRDHLGSITHLKNSSTIDEFSFDAWGRRRDKDDWTYTLTSEPTLFADRGFTGHEYLEDFKLYNMNGRLYDPVVGRFLSPDPYIQDPGFTQNLNRYSYCLNNPLKFTDPSGKSWKSFWNRLGNWMTENNIQIGGGFNYGGGGFVPFAGISGPNGFNASMGYNTSNGQWGFGNLNSGLRYVNTNKSQNIDLWITQNAYAGAWDLLYFKGSIRRNIGRASSSGGSNVPGGDWDSWGVGSVPYTGDAYGGTNFIGPGANADPFTLGKQPVDEIDRAALWHDYAYYQAKTGGVKGALGNAEVRFADTELVYSSVSIMERYVIGGVDNVTGMPISQRTFNLATAVYSAFMPIVQSKFRREGVIYPTIIPEY